MSWYPCEGRWPRFVSWFCRRGFGPAKRYAARKIRQEMDDRAEAQILGLCVRSGKPVVGFLDNKGRMITNVMKRKR